MATETDPDTRVIGCLRFRVDIGQTHSPLFRMQKLAKSSVMDALLDASQDIAFRPLKEGQIVEGKVVAVLRNVLYLDLGGFKTGVVSGKEYREAASAIRELKEGDAVQATIVALDNEEGYVELSMKEASRERAWDILRRTMTENAVVKIKIKEANRGGLIAEMEGVVGFMPVSQLSFGHYPRVEGGDKQKIFQELQKFVGVEMNIRVIAVEQNENKLIFSEKAAENKELKDALSRCTVGAVVSGVISGVVNFGAFVKFDDNLEGLVHISELDWQLIEDPHDLVKVGDPVQAQIIGVEEDRVSLSMKRLKQNPWDAVMERYTVGQIVPAKVIKLNPFGAFAKLDREIHGLIHISEFGSEEKMKEALKVGETYDCTILSIEPRDYKMALGFGKKKPKDKEKKADAEEAPAEEAPEEAAEKTEAPAEA